MPSSYGIKGFTVTIAAMLIAVVARGNAVDHTKKYANPMIPGECENCGFQSGTKDTLTLTNGIPPRIQSQFQAAQPIFIKGNNKATDLQVAKTSTAGSEVIIASIKKTEISEMRAAFLKLIRNPSDINLNVLYAELAEKSGKFNKALVTYERLALLEPNNKKWQNHVRRLRDLSQPPETSIAAVLGLRFDRNGPLNADSIGNRAGYNTSLVVTLDHKRSMGGLKYQATGQFFTDYNVTAPASDLYLGAFQFGPILSFADTWQVRPALLLERSLLNRRKRDSLSYSAGSILNFENVEEGPFRTVDVSMYYVNFHDESPGKDAVVLTGTSGIETKGFNSDSTIRLAPTITYNRPKSGIGTDGFSDQFYEFGFDLSYTLELTESFEFGPTMSYRYREFMDYEPSGNVPRADRNYIFGLETAVTNLIPEMIVLGGYSFERNKSLLEGNTYTNHSVAINFIKSF